MKNTSQVQHSIRKSPCILVVITACQRAGGLPRRCTSTARNVSVQYSYTADTAVAIVSLFDKNRVEIHFLEYFYITTATFASISVVTLIFPVRSDHNSFKAEKKIERTLYWFWWAQSVEALWPHGVADSRVPSYSVTDVAAIILPKLPIQYNFNIIQGG